MTEGATDPDRELAHRTSDGSPVEVIFTDMGQDVDGSYLSHFQFDGATVAIRFLPPPGCKNVSQARFESDNAELAKAGITFAERPNNLAVLRQDGTPRALLLELLSWDDLDGVIVIAKSAGKWSTCWSTGISLPAACMASVKLQCDAQDAIHGLNFDEWTVEANG